MMAVMMVLSCQAATSTRDWDPMDPTHAGAMTTALASESAQPGAGATVDHIVMQMSCPICAPSTSQRMSAAPTAATTRWSATVTGPARSGAGAKANLTAEIV